MGWYDDLGAPCPEICPLWLIEVVDLLKTVWSFSSLTEGRKVWLTDAAGVTCPDTVNLLWDFALFSQQIPALYPGSANSIHVACPESLAHIWILREHREFRNSLGPLGHFVEMQVQKKELAQGHILCEVHSWIWSTYTMCQIFCWAFVRKQKILVSASCPPLPTLYFPLHSFPVTEFLKPL